MSEVMLLGVLRMPPELWSGDAIDVRQRHGFYVSAAEEIERLMAIVDQFPKDAEGNAVYPGRELVSTYCIRSIQQPREVVEVAIGRWRFGNSGWYNEGDKSRACYGSVEAAEKAIGAS